MSTPRAVARHSWLDSARTRIVLTSAVIIGLLIAAFGVFIHFAVQQTLMSTVDSELRDRIRPEMNRPTPPPFGGPGQFGNFQPGGGPGDQGQNPPPDQDQFQGQPGGSGGSGQGQDQRFGGNPPQRNQMPPPMLGATSPYRPRRFHSDGAFVQPPDPQGRIAGVQTPWSQTDIQRAKTADGPVYTTLAGATPLRLITQRVTQGNHPGDIVQCAYPLGDILRAQRGVDSALLWLVPAAILVALVGGFAVTANVFQRVGALATAASGMDAENLSASLPVSGNDEFARLASAFNGLLARLKTAFETQNRLIEKQRRFTADASHELKTPLTIIRGTTSLALAQKPFAELGREEVEDIDRASESMGRLVNDLLTLARYDDGAVIEKSSVSIRTVINNTFLAISATAKDRCRLIASADDICTLCNEVELTRVFVNLIENASQAIGDKSGTIQVCLDKVEGCGRVTISDNGPGIDPCHLSKLFDRFYRIDSARSSSGVKSGGTGLGLPICKSIVESIGGTISITSAGIGKGATVTVDLPLVG